MDVVPNAMVTAPLSQPGVSNPSVAPTQAVALSQTFEWGGYSAARSPTGVSTIDAVMNGQRVTLRSRWTNGPSQAPEIPSQVLVR